MPIKPGSLGRPSGPTHRKLEDRSAETRLRHIEAAIHCLRTYGYAATSTILVAEIAGLSRGSLLHHFRTKVDLMLAVAEHVVEQQNAFVKNELERFAPGRDRWIGLTEVTWEAVKQPGAMALLEIMMASRSDADLGERFPPLAEKLAQSQRRGAWSLARLLGITDRERVETMSQLHRSAMQGLSLLLMFQADDKAMDPMIGLLKEYKEFITGQMVAAADPAPRP
jgi:AcrR family transcriptional regulator